MMEPEIGIVFRCGRDALLGILHPAAPARARGVLIVVGGPQYRVGSHRQFVVLARSLAAAGYPTFRFDYRGIGDSDGDYPGFENIGADLNAAVDAFFELCPGVTEVVLWGLCDAASAILFYAHTDRRVCGITLLNPWIRTTLGEAKTYLRHYYPARIVEGAFWWKLITGNFRSGAAARSLCLLFKEFLIARAGQNDPANCTLPERMLEGWRRFGGPVLLVMSGNDLVAREFEDVTRGSVSWRELLASPRTARRNHPDADHTFSRCEWQDEVTLWTTEWLSEFGAERGK